MSPKQPLSETEKAYLAGFIDGEGCIHISKRAPRYPAVSPEFKLMVIVAQSEFSCLEHWRVRLNMGRVHDITPPSGRNAIGIQYTKRHYIWQLVNRQAVTILHFVLPYLIIKKDQAQVALEFIATCGNCGQDRLGVSRSMNDLREHYRLTLMSMKRSEGPLVLEPRLQRLSDLLASQLEFNLEGEIA